MDHITISLRNLLRNYKRTMLTLSVLVLGIVGMLVYAGYIDFSMWGYREETISGGLGHLRVYHSGYNTRGGESYLDYLMENEKDVYRELIRNKGIREITSELEINGLVSNGNTSEMTMSRGYDTDSVSVIRNSFTLKEGSFVTNGGTYQIALGVLLAEKLDARVGSYLTYMTTTRHGALNAIDLEVVGILETGLKEYDERLSVMSIETAKLLLDVEAADKFIVMLENTDDVPAIAKEFKKKTAALDIEVKTWDELAQFYNQVKAMNESYFLITQMIILVIVAFSIINTMRMVIYERMREIGTLRAIGMTKTGMVTMFMTEGLWLGIFAVIFGIAAAHLVAWIINVSGGIYISPPPGQSNGYHAMIRPDMIRYFQAAAIVIGSTIVGSLVPAIRAAGLKIDESLRYI
ncbi:MAG: ABC transporter permease [Spirochaetes bacterium]|nr:ABC transporter permease [Spirochaetota bacterium]MBN2769372.1 ABC transporter permease [Spirochaetota bacterium]